MNSNERLAACRRTLSSLSHIAAESLRACVAVLCVRSRDRAEDQRIGRRSVTQRCCWHGRASIALAFDQTYPLNFILPPSFHIYLFIYHARWNTVAFEISRSRFRTFETVSLFVSADVGHNVIYVT